MDTPTYFDALLSLGRTNYGSSLSPCTQSDALKLMDNHSVTEAMVYHTLARDADPAGGNQALCREVTNRRLHPIWAFEPAVTMRDTPEMFLSQALKGGAKAFLINPMIKNIHIDRSPRIMEFAMLLESRRIPLFLTYRRPQIEEDIIDWYEIADFCCRFPKLPVYTWEWRIRANRPLLDSLIIASNLNIVLSSLWQAGMVEEICERFSRNRLVFSLGLPYLDPGTFPAVVAYANLDNETKQAISGGTIQAVLEDADYGL